MSKTRIFGLLFSLVLLGFLGSCSKGLDTVDPGSTTTETTTIYGQITDESGAALPGVKITADVQTTTTDDNGIFIIKNATVPKGRAVIVAKKSGYFNAARAEAPGVRGATKMELSMMKTTLVAAVDATAGGTAAIPGGASLQFDAGSFTTASGAAYSGLVYIAARYLHPNSPTFYNYFSGDNAGRTTANEDVSLISCGVLRVKLTTPTGEDLLLATGKQATINFPKPANPNAPAVMPLWYFDETIGIWKEEGSATLTAGVYVGKVSHFSDWNLDYKGATCTATLRVLCDDVPIEGVVVSVIGKDSNYFHREGITGSDGRITFVNFPADITVLVDIQASRNKGLYYINTPLTVNAIPGQEEKIGDIILNSSCPGTLQGTLMGCDDSQGEGLVRVSSGAYTTYIYTKSGGFSLQVPSASPLTVNAMDVGGNNATPVDVLPLTAREVRSMTSSIKVCGNLAPKFTQLDIPSFKGQYTTMGLTQDGSKIAVTNYYNSGKVYIYETATGNALMDFTLAASGYISTLQFSADGKRLLVSMPNVNATKVYDVSGATATLVSSVTGDLGSAALSDDGLQIIGTINKRVKIYSANDGSLTKTLSIPVSSDSSVKIGYNQIENAVVYPLSGGLGFTVWSIANDAQIRTVAATVSRNDARSFSENGEHLTTSSDYQTWAIYNTLTGAKTIDIIAQGLNAQDVLLSNSYLFLLESITNGSLITYFKLSDGSAAGIKKLVSGTGYVASMAISRDESYLAASIDGGVRIWKLK